MKTWWNDYIGIPYKEKGRDKSGLDCWGLLRLVYSEQFNIDLPSFVDQYEANNEAQIAELIALNKENWEQTETPVIGDAVLLRVNGHMMHVGIVISPNQFLHVREGGDAVIERFDSGMWRHRVVGFYRYNDKADTGDVTLAIAPHPFKTERIDGQIPAGSTVADVIEFIKDRYPVAREFNTVPAIFVNGKLIAQDQWEMIPKEGDVIQYRAVATGGSVFRMILSVAVVVAAALLAPPLLAAIGVAATPLTLALASAGLSIVGNLLVNAIFPIRPPKPPKDPGTAKAQNLLQGGANTANFYGAIPVVLGRERYTAFLGAQIYAETNTTVSYLRMLLVWGYGPMQVSDLRIGETPLNTLEAVTQETLTGYGDTAESKTNFNAIYPRDVQQVSINQKMVTENRTATIATIARVSNVVNVTTTGAHSFDYGRTVTISGTTNFNGAYRITEVTSATVFKFAMTGADISESVGSAQIYFTPTVDRVIDEECDAITVTFHFPEGLRGVSSVGNIFPALFRANVQIRQLNSETLAPVSSWGYVEKEIPQNVVTLAPAWFNVDNDEELEKVYRWTRVSVDEYNKIIVRHGAFTTSVNSNPTGNLLTRLQQSTYGLNTTYDRLPALGEGEEELYQICVFGNDIYQTIDRRASGGLSVTGCDISYIGLQATISSGLIVRSQVETVRIGGEYEPFFKRKDAFSYNVSFKVARGKYEVRVIKTSTSVKTFSDGKGYYYNDSYLLAVTAYGANRPVNPPAPLAMTAIRVKATNQINGNLDGISATVQSICKDWDRNTLTWVERPTRNPASLFRYVLQHPANAKRLADSAIDLDELVTWHNYCRVNGFMYDAVISDQESLLDVLRDICAAGRSSPSYRDGKWSVITDKPRTVIAQYFTPHNSWGFESVKTLPKLPHAFRVNFRNSEKGYQPDEMIVYNDGYSAANATLFEELTLPGVTTKNAIFKHARFHFAQLKLRPETYTLNADIEHLVCTRGDRVKVTHDVPLWGLGTGRINDRPTSTTLVLDQPVPMDAGVQYTIRIRLADGSSVTRTVAAALTDGYYTEITVTSSLTTTQAAAGNLFMFGALSEESVDLIVQSIEPSENMSARLTLVDYSPAVYDSDTETIPAFDSQITLPPLLLQQKITVSPTISNLVSDESVLIVLSPGVYAYQIRASFTNPKTLPMMAKYVEGQIDFLGDTAQDWQTTTSAPISNGVIYFGDVLEGQAYKIRLRYVSEDGIAGPWVYSGSHTVVGRTTAPATVTGLTAALSGLQVKLDWNDNAELDIVGYEVRTSDAGWGTESGKIFRGSVSTCNVTPAAAGVAATWYVKAFDAVGLYSTTAASVSFTVGVPANPASITETFADTSLTNATITLDWPNVSPAAGLSGYIVSYGTVTKTVNANTITLPADWIGVRTFTVKTVDLLGNQSSGISKAITKLAPNPVTNLRAQVIDNNVLLYWRLPAKTTLPIQYVLVSKGATFAGSTLIGTKDGGFTSLQETQAGTYTYWVVVVDTDNNNSTPVSTTVNVSEPPDFVFHGSFDSTLAGTKSSAITEDGAIVLPVNTTETWASHFTSRSWNTPQDQINAGFPIFIQPANGTGYYEETFDFGTILSSSRVTTTYSGVVISGSPTITITTSLSDDNVTFTSFAGADVFGTNFRYVKIRLTVTELTGTGLYQLTGLTSRLDAKLKNDAGTVSALSTDANGTLFNFTKEFIDVTSITVSASSTTAVTPVYNFQDANISGTYSVTSNVATINATAHDLIVGQKVRLTFSTGTAPNGVYTVASVPGVNSFTVAITTANTSGSVSMYPQSARIYLFNSAGTRVSATASWSIKGY